MVLASFQAIENVLSIGVNFPMAPENEIYDCICTSPLNNNPHWAKYTKSQCLVSLRCIFRMKYFLSCLRFKFRHEMELSMVQIV